MARALIMKKHVWLVLATFLLCMSCLGVRAKDVDEPDTADSELETSSETVEAPPEVPRPELISQHQLQLERLQRAYPEQFRPLQTPYDQAAALYQPANRSPARGWVILLPGSGEAADSAYNIQGLATLLPDSGWHTLSLQAPASAFTAWRVSPAPSPPPAQPETDSEESDEFAEEEVPTVEETAVEDSPDTELLPETQITDETVYAEITAESLADLDEPFAVPLPDDHLVDNETQPPSYSQRVHALLEAAILHATTEPGQHLILLGQHEGAYWVLEHANDQAPQTTAVVLLHPRQPSGDAPTTLPHLIQQHHLPTVDLYNATNAGDQKQARLRLDSSKRNPGSKYQQRAIHQPVKALQQDELLRKTKGWLSLFDVK